MNQKITDLVPLTRDSASLQDLVLVVDVNDFSSPTGETKKMELVELASVLRFGSTSSLVIKDEGTVVTPTATSINFVGNAISASASGTDVTIQALSSSFVIKNEGTSLTSSPSSMDFVGDGITATAAGSNITITVDTGSSANLPIHEDYSQIAPVVSILNFTGNSVSTRVTGSYVTVDVSTIDALGYTSTTLTNANKTLLPRVSSSYQNFRGTLTGPVVISCSTTNAQAGHTFHLRLNNLVTTAFNSLTISSGATPIKILNSATTWNGTMDVVYTGTIWQIWNTTGNITL